MDAPLGRVESSCGKTHATHGSRRYTRLNSSEEHGGEVGCGWVDCRVR